MKLLGAIAFLIGISISPSAFAKVLLDFDLSYLQSTQNTEPKRSDVGSFYSGGLFVDASGKEKFYLGAMYTIGSQTQTLDSAVDTFSSQDIILGARYFLGRQKILSVAGGYGVVSRATQKRDGAEPEKLLGTSFYGKIALSPEYRKWNFGVALIYIQSSYSQRTISETTSSVSLTRTNLWPTISVTYRW